MLETTIKWILDNKDWLFSGLGLVIGAWMIRILFKKKKNDNSIEISPHNNTGSLNVILNTNGLVDNSGITSVSQKEGIIKSKEQELRKLLQKKDELSAKTDGIISNYQNILEKTDELKLSYDHNYQDITGWLSNSNLAITERLIDHLVKHKKVKSGKCLYPSDQRKVKALKRELRQLLELLEISMTVGNCELLDEPFKYTTYEKCVYKIALKHLLNTLPNASPESKELFIEYVNYLIRRIYSRG